MTKIGTKIGTKFGPRAGLLMAGCAGMALSMASTTAIAQTTSAEAQEIATALKGYIDEFILEPNPEVSLDLNGAIEVRPAGDHYTGSIPAGRLLVETDHDGIASFEFVEPLTFDIRVTDRGWYDTTFVVPSSVRISADTDPTAAVTVTIGGQSGAMTIAPEYQSVVQSDMVWTDISLQVAGMAGDMTIAELSLEQNSDEVASGLFDAEQSIDLSGFRVSVPDENVLIELDYIGMVTVATAMNLAALQPFGQAINDIIPRLEEDPEDPVPYGELRTLLSETPNLLASLQGTGFLEGLRVDTPDANIALSEASSGITLTGLDTEFSTVGISLNLTGFEIEPTLPFEDLLASDTGYDIRIVDLPTDVVLEWLDTLLETIPVIGPDEAFEASMLPLYSQVADSGAYLDIVDVHYDMPAGGISLSGQMQPDIGAMFGVTAGAELIATNMARMIEAMNTLPDFGSEAAAGFTVIQALGAREVNDRGEPVHTYEFEVTPDGAVTLNGNDLGPILEQMR